MDAPPPPPLPIAELEDELAQLKQRRAQLEEVLASIRATFALRKPAREAPFACPLCRKGYAAKSSLDRHVRTVHAKGRK